VRILLRGGTAAQWTTANPTLAAREVGVETDTRKAKIGDGSTAWNSLGYIQGGVAALDDLSEVAITAAASGDILRHNGTAWVDTPGTTHYEVAGAVATHEADTTSVHGISSTTQLAAIAALTPAQGDLLYFNGTSWTRLAAGTSGHYLQTLGAAANPQWASAGAATQNVALLASSVLGSSSPNMDFTSIPQTYRHLKIVAQFRTDRAANFNDDVIISINNDTTDANYRQNQAVGAAGSGNVRYGAHAAAASSAAGVFAQFEILVPYYTTTDRHKHTMATGWQDNSTFGLNQITHLIWANTAAITRLTFAPRIGTNLVTGSSVHIYGVDAL
jgi:hypothetical protein